MKRKESNAMALKTIATEDRVNRFYLKPEEKCAEAAAKDTLLYPDKEDVNHKEYLEHDRQESFALSVKKVECLPDCRGMEFAGTPGGFFNVGSKKACLLASARERNSRNPFAGMVSRHKEGESRDLFLHRANKEIKYEKMLISLLRRGVCSGRRRGKFPSGDALLFKTFVAHAA